MNAAELKAQIEEMIQKRIELHFERMTNIQNQNRPSNEEAWLTLRDLLSKIEAIETEGSK